VAGNYNNWRPKLGSLTIVGTPYGRNNRLPSHSRKIVLHVIDEPIPEPDTPDTLELHATLRLFQQNLDVGKCSALLQHGDPSVTFSCEHYLKNPTSVVLNQESGESSGRRLCDFHGGNAEFSSTCTLDAILSEQLGQEEIRIEVLQEGPGQKVLAAGVILARNSSTNSLNMQNK